MLENFQVFYSVPGRIHSAIVAAINDEMRCATVEWFEQGETKGKEVDMTAIESLNPDIIILKPGERYNMHDRTLTPQTEFNKLQRVSAIFVPLIFN